MSVLFSDPMAFLDSPASQAAARHPLFPFNLSALSVDSVNTFNHPQSSVQLDRLVDTVESAVVKNRSPQSRRIKGQQKQQQQVPSVSNLETIPIVDLDHPFNSQMLGSTANSEHLGPLATRSGSDWPILPQFTYSQLSNGTLIQIPILWTAMSLAMGLEIRGDIIRGLPCIKRLNQLFCPTAGNRYPGDPIERFIDENKALIRRMYGEFTTPPPDTPTTTEAGGRRSVRRSDWTNHIRDSELFAEDLEADGFSSQVFGFNSTEMQQRHRPRRQSSSSRKDPPKDTKDAKDNKLDACESTVEVVTPFWAANSSGKIRAIVNTQHFEQAVHQEVCSKPKTGRCTGDCSCEQKYKWHRLLAYDPDNDCKGIFMDWFLFPSCCVCRCLPL